MIFLIGPHPSSGAHDSRAPLEWRGPMKVFFQGGRVAEFVDSWPETLVPSASNRSTPEWTLVDSRQGRFDGSSFALAAHLGPRMGRAIDRAQAGGVDVGVALGGRQASVAQQLLDGAQVAAGRQQVGGEG